MADQHRNMSMLINLSALGLLIPAESAIRVYTQAELMTKPSEGAGDMPIERSFLAIHDFSTLGHCFQFEVLFHTFQMIRMPPSTCFLLQSGAVLLHKEDDRVIFKRTDILVRNNLIVSIEEDIPTPEDVTEVLDCSDTIISPGFVDTHRHLWQTQLKGRFGDDLLPEYAARGYLAGYFFSSKDIYLGELSGILESIDAGTTTIVDQMHAVYSPAHIEAALEAMITSGIRGILCPTPTRRVKQWSPSLTFEEEEIPSWFMQTLRNILAQRPLGHGRISLGLGFDSFAIPQEEVESIFSQARKSNLHLITAHHLHGPMRE